MAIEQLVISKYLLTKAEKILSENNPISSGLAISLFQDTVESIIWVITKEMDADITRSTHFEQFWKIIPKAKKNSAQLELPLSAKMLELNKARVNFKHYGILPAESEATKFLAYTTQFAQEAVQQFFGLDFSKLSLIDVVSEKNIRGRLKEAEILIEENNLRQGIVSCAKAEYLSLAKFRQILPQVDDRLFSAGGIFGYDQSHEISQVFEYLANYLETLRNSSVANFLGVDLVEYARFRNLSPYIYQMDSGKLRYTLKYQGVFTQSDALFCLNYATQTAISVQQVGMQ